MRLEVIFCVHSEIGDATGLRGSLPQIDSSPSSCNAAFSDVRFVKSLNAAARLHKGPDSLGPHPTSIGAAINIVFNSFTAAAAFEYSILVVTKLVLSAGSE